MTGLPDPDPLAAEARDETARMLLETGHLPQWLDWGEEEEEEKGPGGGGVAAGEQGGKRGDGGWDWRALRMGVVVDDGGGGRGDVAFYDGSFVEDPWRGLRGRVR